VIADSIVNLLLTMNAQNMHPLSLTHSMCVHVLLLLHTSHHGLTMMVTPCWLLTPFNVADAHAWQLLGVAHHSQFQENSFFY
jgi:hypothetical protein